MADYQEQVLRVWEQYEETTAESLNDPDAFLDWAIERRLLKPRVADIRQIMRRDLTETLRNAMRIDENGITYRAKQCIRIVEEGSQLTFIRWFDTDRATRKMMHKAVHQRRQGIVRDCFRLKCDVDHFNHAHSAEEPIQLELDFKPDVAEIEIEEQMEGRRKKAA